MKQEKLPGLLAVAMEPLEVQRVGAGHGVQRSDSRLAHEHLTRAVEQSVPD